MFGDYVKMAAKAAMLIAGVALIVVLFNSITIPALDLSQASNYINVAYTIGKHYIPAFSVLWTLGLSLLTFEITIIGVRISLIAIKWVMKVNE